MDAKSILSFAVTVRCSPPASVKKVPISYPGWICFNEGSLEDNVFYQSMLMVDRTGVEMKVQKYLNLDL